MNKTSCIYKITSNINGKIYVGSSVDYTERIRLHLHYLKNNKHHSVKLQRHVNKYGIEDLSFSILEIVMFKEDLIKREQFYLDSLKPNFNICKVAGSTLGTKMSVETRAKMSVVFKGRKHTEEAKRKISEASKGNKYCVGKKHSKETIKKRSESLIGRKVSEETRRKISLAQIGKKISEESKRKMSIAAKGRTAWMKGRSHTAESIKKMSKSQKGRTAWNKGLIQSKKHREINILSHMGIRPNQETKLKMRLARLGFKNTEEAKENMKIAWILRKQKVMNI